MSGEGRIGKKIILLLATLVAIVDQVSKFIIQHIFSPGSSIPIIKDIFHITLVHNTGAAFGILKARTPYLVIIGIIAAFFILYYLSRLKKDAACTRIAFSLILGGIIGNLIDRLRFGYVIDFLDLRIWPVFNVADSAITIGAILMVIQLIKTKNQRPKIKNTY